MLEILTPNGQTIYPQTRFEFECIYFFYLRTRQEAKGRISETGLPEFEIVDGLEQRPRRVHLYAGNITSWHVPPPSMIYGAVHQYESVGRLCSELAISESTVMVWYCRDTTRRRPIKFAYWMALLARLGISVATTSRNLSDGQRLYVEPALDRLMQS